MSNEHLVPFSPRFRNTRRLMRLFDHPRRIGSHLLPTASVIKTLLYALKDAQIIEFETDDSGDGPKWRPRDMDHMPVMLLEDCLRGDANVRTNHVLQEFILDAQLFSRLAKYAAEKIWEELVGGRPLRLRNEDRIDELWRSFEPKLDQQFDFDQVVADALCPVLARYLKHMPHTGCEKWYTVEETVCYLMAMLCSDRDRHGRSSLDNIWLSIIEAITGYYRRWSLSHRSIS